MATVEELLTRLVNLENEAVQARQRQASAEQALAVAQQRIAQLSSGTAVSTTPPGVIDTRTLGSRSRSRVRRQNGQPGNSRSKRLRVLRTQD